MWPVSGAPIGWPVSGFHSRTVLVVAGRGQPVPVGAERHAGYTAPVWPVSGAPIGWPVSGSHSRTVLVVAGRWPVAARRG